MLATRRLFLPSLLIAAAALATQSLISATAPTPAAEPSPQGVTDRTRDRSSEASPPRAEATARTAASLASDTTADVSSDATECARFVPFAEHLGSVEYFEASPYFNPTSSSLDEVRRQELQHLISAFNLELEDVAEERERLEERHILAKVGRGQYAPVGSDGVRVSRADDVVVTGLRYLDASTPVRVEIRRGEFADLDSNLAREDLLKDRARQLILDLFGRQSV